MKFLRHELHEWTPINFYWANTNIENTT